jgi:hypothetical protein
MQDDTKTEKRAERMEGTLQDIQQAINKVDIWAGALAGFSQPVPEGKFQLPREPR